MSSVGVGVDDEAGRSHRDVGRTERSDRSLLGVMDRDPVGSQRGRMVKRSRAEEASTPLQRVVYELLEL